MKKVSIVLAAVMIGLSGCQPQTEETPAAEVSVETEEGAKTWQEVMPEPSGTLRRKGILETGEDLSGDILFCEAAEEDTTAEVSGATPADEELEEMLAAIRQSPMIQYILEEKWSSFAGEQSSSRTNRSVAYVRDTRKEYVYSYRELAGTSDTKIAVSCRMNTNQLYIDLKHVTVDDPKEATGEITLAVRSLWTINEVVVTMDGEVVFEEETATFGPILSI